MNICRVALANAGVMISADQVRNSRSHLLAKIKYIIPKFPSDSNSLIIMQVMEKLNVNGTGFISFEEFVDGWYL